jgi:hypothetical protein
MVKNSDDLKNFAINYNELSQLCAKAKDYLILSNMYISNEKEFERKSVYQYNSNAYTTQFMKFFYFRFTCFGN